MRAAPHSGLCGPSRWALLLCLCAGALTGCGYRLAAGAARLPAGIRKLHAPVLANNSAEPGAEVLFTQVLREQLTRAGTAGGEGSDARIEGELANISSALNFGLAASYRLSATVRLRLVKDGKVLNQTEVSGSEDYLGGGDVLLTEANRQVALRRLADTLMRDAYDRLTQLW